MQSQLPPLPNSVNNLFRLLFAAMALAFLANCFTPLHIHFDSVRYFNIKDCIEFGCPPDSIAATDYLPYGYTALLITLSKLGILNAFFIAFVNCLFLFTGLYFVQKIFRGLVHPFMLFVIVLFNWTIIKFAAHPLSEMQYIFFSCTSLYCFHLYTQKKSYGWLALAFVFSILTVLTRTVGVSLLPALVLGVLYQHRQEIGRIIKKNKLLIIVCIVVMLVALVVLFFFAKQLKISDYTGLLNERLGGGLGSFIGVNLQNHLRELGEVLVNLPSGKLLEHLPPAAGMALFVALGAGTLLWILYALFAKSSQVPFYIKMYLLFYSFIILNWPYYDPRFWVPVLPLLVAVLLRTPFNRWTWLKWLSRIYLAVYIALGVFAAGYALKVGFNKEEFAKKQASGVYRNEYETYFFGKPQSDTATTFDGNVEQILKKYN
ncbi:hypothetical protein HHL16_04685 [Pseudoflavitalea sp. G-6-1-2]|uniref:hypothetical protein n=1 Tax=Pseudoflavitalea sp. G-6-1-2 TaxID=2728841 RepID=UPI00146EE656|nr:hypothetical protein [Pseudoflavitalea sp. G-6-1-2]NML20154.1 hypothetical protein [Pseudoflavitalea sp. G-6-1-2]